MPTRHGMTRPTGFNDCQEPLHVRSTDGDCVAHAFLREVSQVILAIYPKEMPSVKKAFKVLSRAKLDGQAFVD
jgi:hypothetical protein